ncbi:MAG TPA: FKBP-type peptidyl-prolyl cis-trans isomerase [Allosphingosinicella sp.]
MKKAIFLAALFAATPAFAQAGQPAQPQRDANWHNQQLLHLLDLKPSDGWQTTASGLRYRKVRSGMPDAIQPAPTDTVTIHYVGRFIDGTEFDSSVARGAPATFPLPRLIKGWQEGVPLMAVGDTFEFAIPWSLAYGAKGKGPIPGGATLLFTIELFAVT